MSKAKKSTAAAVLAEVSAALPNLANYAAQTPAGKDYIVRDFSLAEWGRKELAVAEHEMPGLMSVRKKYPTTQKEILTKILLKLHASP